MPRPRPGYVRPSVVACIVCDGQVSVLPKGTIPEGHPDCIAFRQDFTRLDRALARVAAAGHTLPELARIAHTLQSDTRNLVNTWVNEHANPATVAKAAGKVSKPRKRAP